MIPRRFPICVLFFLCCSLFDFPVGILYVEHIRMFNYFTWKINYIKVTLIVDLLTHIWILPFFPARSCHVSWSCDRIWSVHHFVSSAKGILLWECMSSCKHLRVDTHTCRSNENCFIFWLWEMSLVRVICSDRWLVSPLLLLDCLMLGAWWFD